MADARSRMKAYDSAMAYMEHPTHYDSRATHAVLAAAGIHPGRFADHVKVMVAFTREHMQVSSAAMA